MRRQPSALWPFAIEHFVTDAFLPAAHYPHRGTQTDIAVGSTIDWRRYDVDGVPVPLLTAKVSDGAWLCGLGGDGGQEWCDTESLYPTEADALAGAFRAWRYGLRQIETA
ncbi:hypothetical protein [Solimonas marina]|uniref:Uncharacterized protein n=1 Tax=Solimonas marina TaxID=2714601 RepID=A0A969WCN0_9GAMM|nr:hypothetical protein [Solimonas marina]NKF24507.1 hypothetical protein [Solimonas marina]